MTCSEFIERYSDYDDSLIPAAEAEVFRAHMAACPSCARYDRVLRKGRMLARQLPRIEPSDDFVPRLRRRLWQESHRRHGAGARLGARPAAAAAAVTVLLAAAAAIALLAPGSAAGVDSPMALLADRLPAAVRGVVAAGPVAPSGAVARRRPVLPAVGGVAPREWAVQRVDPGGPSSYSPLIVGPPAYGDVRARLEASIPVHRTLD